MNQQADTPIARLREKHRHCSCWGENCGVKRYPKEDWNSHCEKCAVTWPCDTIAALDALEVEGRDIQFRMFELQTRLDAATKLIQEAMSHIHMTEPLTDCELCTPFRAWLAGNKEDGSE